MPCVSLDLSPGSVFFETSYLVMVKTVKSWCAIRTILWRHSNTNLIYKRLNEIYMYFFDIFSLILPTFLFSHGIERVKDTVVFGHESNE